MTFDTTHKPNRDKLSPHIVLLMDRAFYRNRAAGLNVQFIGETGDLDEWSFNDVAHRDAFVAGLARQGIASATSEISA